ncbi:Cytochrome P450 3A24 [Rhizoctonia solani AG-1 IB]|uniref:Cytochrome P450 3A24 n=1 Tax=Thanatephorus cucumeris (strain AG1-IB / isolate 7/3/14) TaxID=1108050 RepID=M5C705_THACB|nr:Cytochrome P450 3A24 [Rhizoctonia solani AG-1 IB]
MLAFVACLIAGLLTVFLIRRHYRIKHLVPLDGPPPSSYLTGHFKQMFGLTGLGFQREVFRTYGPTVRMTGVMGESFIFTFDPGFIHTVLVKERSKFERNEGGTLMVRSMFGGGLLGFRGDEHRYHRKLLNPVFTMQHLREHAIDVFHWTTTSALEFIGEAGLGYSFESFSGKQNEYSVASKSVFQLFAKLVPFIPLYPYLYRLPITQDLLSYIPIPLLQQVLRATSLQNEQAEQILGKRKDLLERGVDLESVTGRGKDILTQLKLKHSQFGSVLIFAGHETSSSVIARLLDIIAHNTEIQDKLRNEITKSKEEDVLDLPYLDAVVKETLRLHAPVTYLGRICEEDTVVPLTYPVSTPTGTITGLPVKKGTRLALSVAFSNRDEKAWGERAEDFWPERWLESEQPSSSHLQGVYSSMMTFGLGQYACIGFKFALMEIKVMTAQLLKSFVFEPSAEEYAWEARLITT